MCGHVQLWRWAGCGPAKRRRSSRTSCRKTGIRRCGAGHVRRWSGSYEDRLRLRLRFRTRRRTPLGSLNLNLSLNLSSVSPVDHEDLLGAVESDGKAGPPKPSIHVEPVAVSIVVPAHSSATAVW